MVKSVVITLKMLLVLSLIPILISSTLTGAFTINTFVGAKDSDSKSYGTLRSEAIQSEIESMTASPATARNVSSQSSSNESNTQDKVQALQTSRIGHDQSNDLFADHPATANQIQATSDIHSEQVGTFQAVPCSADVCTAPGEQITFSFECSNPDLRVQVKCIMVSGPPGATFSSTTGNPAVGTFNWVAGEDGEYQASFQAVTVFCPPDLNCSPSEVITRTILVVSNQPPIVDAGPEITVNPGETVQLQATASDPEGDPMTFSWTQIDISPGTAVTLNNPESLSPTFLAPNTPGALLTFQFTANDGVGSSITVAHVRIGPAQNQPPIPVATADKPEVFSGDIVLLDGTQSHDPDPGDSIVSYEWQQIDPPGGVIGTSATVQFAAPKVDTETTYTFGLAVRDSHGAIGSTAVDVLVKPPSICPAPSNPLSASETLISLPIPITTDEIIDCPNIYSISVSSFIPGNNLQAPPQYMCFADRHREPLYLKGDERSFDPTSNSYRTRQLITVVTGSDPDGIKDGTVPQNLVGESKAYAPNALANGRIDPADDDSTLNDCHLLDQAGTASNKNMHIEISKINDKKISVHMFGGAGLPFSAPVRPLQAPDIDWDFTLVIEESGSVTTWTLTGKHDGFPAYEIYINNQKIYGYSPGPGPYTLSQIFSLYPPLDIPRFGTFKFTGTL